MSEFSESYHLRTRNTDDAIALLLRAKRRGFVFPSANGWVTFVAEKNNFEPDPVVVSSNQGILLHYVSAEDHGWSFSLFEKQSERCRFSCQWENDVEIDPSRYLPDALSIIGHPFDSAALSEIVSVDTIEGVFEQEPSKKFAELFDLPHFEWLAFDYVARDLGEGDGEWPDAIKVE